VQQNPARALPSAGPLSDILIRQKVLSVLANTATHTALALYFKSTYLNIEGDL